MTLTPEQVHLFRHNGFLKLPDVLPEDAVGCLKEAVRQDIRACVEPVVRDRQGRVVRLSSLWDRGPVFREAMTHALVLDPLESLLGPNIEIITNRHNHATLRLAGDGGEYFHRDVLQWTRTILTVIFYLEETTLENGCTLVVPGTHGLMGLPAVSLAESAWVRESGLLEQAVPVPMPAGGLLAIDSLLFHSPGRNATDVTRMSMTVGYHSVDELCGVEKPRRVLARGERILGNDR